MKITSKDLKLLVGLEGSNTYRQVLKPYLLDRIHNEEVQMSEPKNEFEAVRNEIRRLSTIKIITKLIDFIEEAEDRLNKLRDKER